MADSSVVAQPNAVAKDSNAVAERSFLVTAWSVARDRMVEEVTTELAVLKLDAAGAHPGLSRIFVPPYVMANGIPSLILAVPHVPVPVAPPGRVKHVIPEA